MRLDREQQFRPRENTLPPEPRRISPPPMPHEKGRRETPPPLPIEDLTDEAVLEEEIDIADSDILHSRDTKNPPPLPLSETLEPITLEVEDEDIIAERNVGIPPPIPGEIFQEFDLNKLPTKNEINERRAQNADIHFNPIREIEPQHEMVWDLLNKVERETDDILDFKLAFKPEVSQPVTPITPKKKGFFSKVLAFAVGLTLSGDSSPRNNEQTPPPARIENTQPNQQNETPSLSKDGINVSFSDSFNTETPSQKRVSKPKAENSLSSNSTEEPPRFPGERAEEDLLEIDGNLPEDHAPYQVIHFDTHPKLTPLVRKETPTSRQYFNPNTREAYSLRKTEEGIKVQLMKFDSNGRIAEIQRANPTQTRARDFKLFAEAKAILADTTLKFKYDRNGKLTGLEISGEKGTKEITNKKQLQAYENLNSAAQVVTLFKDVEGTVATAWRDTSKSEGVTSDADQLISKIPPSKNSVAKK